MNIEGYVLEWYLAFMSELSKQKLTIFNKTLSSSEIQMLAHSKKKKKHGSCYVLGQQTSTHESKN